MKAFIFLANEVCFNIFANVLTIYPVRKKSNNDSCPHSKSVYSKINKLLDHLENMDLIGKYIHREDEVHPLLHQGFFQKNKVHFHVQFGFPIYLEFLKFLTEKFQEYQLLSHAEARILCRGFKKVAPLAQSSNQESSEEQAPQKNYV